MNSTRNHPQKGNKLEGLMEGREEGREEGIRASRFEIARNLRIY